MKKSKNPYQESSVAVVERLVSDLGLRITQLAIQDRIKSHHEYPSLITLRDSLAEWNINSIAVKLEPEHLKEVTLPCIALISSGGDPYFVLINKVTGNEITFYDPVEGDTIAEIDAFAKKWDGTTLIIMIDENSGEKNYPIARRKELIGKLRTGFVYGTMIVLAVSLVLLSGASATWLLLAKFAGLALCILLMVEDLGLNNQVSEKICGLNDQTSCKSVLSSPAAKLFGLIGMAEIGLLYFSGGIIGIVLSSIADLQQPFINLLLGLNVLALPYTFFSVYYQARVVKKWCPLCLGVQVLLWTEFLIVLPGFLNFTTEIVNGITLLLFLVAFLTPAMLLVALKPFLIKDEEAISMKKAAIKFKRDEELFDFNLDRSPYTQISTLPNDLVLGNANADIELTIVSAPTCPFCSYAHSILAELLRYAEDEIKVIARFTTDHGKPTSESNIFFKHLLSLQPTVERETLQQAIHDWFADGDYGKWASKYPVVMPDNIEQILAEHTQWTRYVGITHTPTIFINGKEVSSLYSMNDLKYHIIRKLEMLTPVE